jgi:WD40 repeat protein
VIATSLENIHDLQLTSDGGTLLIAGGTPGVSGVIQIVTQSTGVTRQTIEVGADVILRLGQMRDGRTVIAVGAESVCAVCDLQTGQILSRFAGHSGSVMAVQPMADTLVASAGVDQTIRIWNPMNGQLQRTLNNHVATINDLAVQDSSAEVSETGNLVPLLASTADDRTVRLWQPRNGRLLRFRKLPSIARSIVFSPDGTQLVLGCDDGQIRILDVMGLQVLREKITESGRIFVIVRSSDPDEFFVGGSLGASRISLK